MGARCVGYSDGNTKFPPKITTKATLEVTVRVFFLMYLFS